MSRTNFEKLEVYNLAEKLSDKIWSISVNWDNFNRDTLGKQVVRSADSVGANIAEGSGRYSIVDNRRFVYMARASLYETKHWLRRAYSRGLLKCDEIEELRRTIDELSPRLNAYINSLNRMKKRGNDSN